MHGVTTCRLNFENFILEVRDPRHKDFLRVMAWSEGDATFDEPISSGTIEIYMRHIYEPTTVDVTGRGVTGRGNGYESICMAKKAITHFHRVGCRGPDGRPPEPETYIAHPDVLMIFGTAEQQHVPKGAAEFEFVSGVRSMHCSLWGPTGDGSISVHGSNIERLYAWALILMMLNHMARKADFAGEHVHSNAFKRCLAPGRWHHALRARARDAGARAHDERAFTHTDACAAAWQCPDACSIQTPDGADEWEVEASVPCPRWFSFIFHSWKAPRPRHVKKHRVRTDRNRVSPAFCPVHNYTEFAVCSGLSLAIAAEQMKPAAERGYVPMWPALTADGIDPYTAGTEDLFDRLITPVLQHAFADKARLPTPHSLRVAGLIWYLRCMVAQERSKLAGRWMGRNLKSWDKYARGGEEKAEYYRRSGRIDPVFMFWCARDSFVAYIES